VRDGAAIKLNCVHPEMADVLIHSMVPDHPILPLVTNVALVDGSIGSVATAICSRQGIILGRDTEIEGNQGWSRRTERSRFSVDDGHLLTGLVQFVVTNCTRPSIAVFYTLMLARGRGGTCDLQATRSAPHLHLQPHRCWHRHRDGRQHRGPQQRADDRPL
jgi:hypothetical protein